MTNCELGFDEWFQKKYVQQQIPECGIARVTRVDRERYLVRHDLRELQAEPTGKLLYGLDSPQDRPCVGDWVQVQYYNDNTLAIIHDVLPRKTFLRRKSPGKNVDYQMIASNIDVAFLIQACDLDFNVRRMERYLVMTSEGGIRPVILLSKSDLATPDELQRRADDLHRAHIASAVIPFSSVTGQGMDAVQQHLEKGKTCCLLGSSGVGKTTLLNHLLGRDDFATAPVRESDGRGRHTTASRQLIVLQNGALLIDTPGMRELGMIATEGGIDETFSDIRDLGEECRFKDCTHTSETGCSILMALQSGILAEDRYASYMKLRKESEFHQMTYIERRKKDKQFGRMINKALKQMKKR